MSDLFKEYSVGERERSKWEVSIKPPYPVRTKLDKAFTKEKTRAWVKRQKKYKLAYQKHKK